jgi:hypothetical protein
MAATPKSAELRAGHCPSFHHQSESNSALRNLKGLAGPKNPYLPALAHIPAREDIWNGNSEKALCL